jgi:FAD/FMN-containing dehydrogenase
VRDWSDALAPYSTGGVYVNFISDDDADQVRAAYGRATYDRLAQVKAKYDPDNVFHLNQNIPPATPVGQA